MRKEGRSKEEIIQCIESTEHAAFIKDVCEFLILKREEKCNAVVIHGAANSGKTQFLNKMKELFKLEYYQQTRGNFDCRYKGGRVEPHFVVCEEGCLMKLFNLADKYHSCKLALEGQPGRQGGLNKSKF